VRISTNLANLASLQAIEFVDGPISKALDLCVLDEHIQNFLYKAQHLLRTSNRLASCHNLIPVSMLSVRNARNYEMDMQVQGN